MDDRAAQFTAREAQAEPSQRSSFSWLVWVGFFVLVVYPLSTGPVCKLVNHGHLPMQVLYIYYPLGKLSNQVPALDRFFNWYVKDFWKVR